MLIRALKAEAARHVYTHKSNMYTHMLTCTLPAFLSTSLKNSLQLSCCLDFGARGLLRIAAPHLYLCAGLSLSKKHMLTSGDSRFTREKLSLNAACCYRKHDKSDLLDNYWHFSDVVVEK